MAAKIEEFRINLIGSIGGSDLILMRKPDSLNVYARCRQWPTQNNFHDGPITGQEGDYQMWARLAEKNTAKQQDMINLIKRSVLLLQQIPLVNEEGTVQERDTTNEPVPTKYIFPDGTPFPGNHCAMPDHYMTTFSVTVRSKLPFYYHQLQNVVETKYEVVGLKTTEETCVVSNPK